MPSPALSGTLRIPVALRHHPKVAVGWSLPAGRGSTRRCYRAVHARPATARTVSQAASHYPDTAPVACDDAATALIANRVARMFARNWSSLALVNSAAPSGALAAISRRKLSPDPCVKDCRTLLQPPGSGSIWYRHAEDGREGSWLSSSTTQPKARGWSGSVTTQVTSYSKP